MLRTIQRNLINNRNKNNNNNNDDNNKTRPVTWCASGVNSILNGYQQCLIIAFLILSIYVINNMKSTFCLLNRIMSNAIMARSFYSIVDYLSVL
uniref:Uncharacterized protein n=1 Tax=Glossina brevipalpis TaxID=37001 RepID=A0A1A9W203_9MUSC